MDKENLRAFPTGSWDYDGQNNVLPFQHEGMTLRDYFAAKALQALIGRNGDMGNMVTHANMAYMYADAMLKARK